VTAALAFSSCAPLISAMLQVFRPSVARALAVRPAPWRATLARAASTASVPASLVKQLREATGAPMMECRNALLAEGVNGDVEKASEWLRKKGIAAATKKAGRAAAQGLVCAVVHPSNLAGFVVEVSCEGGSQVCCDVVRCGLDWLISELANPSAKSFLQLNCETDFVSRNEMFKDLAVKLGETALATLAPSSAADAATPAFTSPLLPSATAAAPAAQQGDLAALQALPMSGDAASASAAVTELVAKVRENMVLRGVAGIALPPPPPGGFSVVARYVHNSAGTPGLGAIGVLLGLQAVAATPAAVEAAVPALQDLARKLAMHAAASAPVYPNREDVPAEALEQQRAALRAEAASSGKPAAIVDRMVEGRLGKYYAEAVLADQPYVLSEEGAPVRKVLEEARKKLGLSTLRVAGLVRTKVGDAAKAADAAAEAAAAAAGGAAAPLA